MDDDKNLQDAIKAKAQYDRLNVNTVERRQSYCPKMKIWYFEKTAIDENAKKFVTKTRKQKKEIIPKKVPVTKKVKTIKTKKEGISLHVNSKTQQAYDLYLQGKNHKEIAQTLNISKEHSRGYVARRRKQLGLTVEPTNKDTRGKVEVLLKEGKSIQEIMNTLNKSRNGIKFHIDRINKEK